jgi:RNA polymerase sigma-70 factor (ECF subfamily)
LDDLLKIYTDPVDRYLIAVGVPRQQVADVRQSFFLDLLEHGAVARVDPSRTQGFRYFLKGALQNHIGRTRESANAVKRGGGRIDLSLDDVNEETGQHRVAEPKSSSDPEREFMVGWMVVLVRRALDRVSEGLIREGRDRELEVYRSYLTMDDEPDHAILASLLGINLPASRTRLRRLRRRFHDAIREIVAETVDDPADVDDELRSFLI